jgi:hypothetical protein
MGTFRGKPGRNGRACGRQYLRFAMCATRSKGPLARIAGVLDPYALPNDVSLHLRDVPVGLGKMLLFLKAADRL